MRCFHGVFILSILISLWACSSSSVTQQQALQNVSVYRPLADYDPQLRLQVEGRFIVNGKGEKVRLKGVAFGNEVWANTHIPNKHHNEQDFERVKAMGFNSIRFYLNYQTFESDSAPYQYHQAGWDWLDQNLEWAEKHGIYLVLNMHVPQGGFQSLGGGDALWEQAENQQRLVSLWQAIAKRYRGHPNIAGLDLLNEPITSRSKQQWVDLATTALAAIRQVNPEHIVFVERLLAVQGKWQIDQQQNFFKLDDPNIVYQYHFYEPIDYTHQQASWLSQFQAPAQYPDPERVKVIGSPHWYDAYFNNPRLSEHNADWQYLQGHKFALTDPKVELMYPALVSANNAGDTWFKQVTITEYAADGEQVLRHIEVDLSQHSNWYFWAAKNKGASRSRILEGEDAIQISNTSGDANSGSSQQFIVPTLGHYYQISAWAKTSNAGSAAHVQARLDFQTGVNAILPWDKALIAEIIRPIEQWGMEQKVPLYLGEFGCIAACFKDQAGGLQWVSDVLDVADSYQTHFNLHTYHEDPFGLYFGFGSLPQTDKSNQPLIQMLTERLND
ncbi:cellulase family glycosylhydrolase [Agarivorans sp. Toyoura001]|uniref:cellulase family glycosylhydrolase n=1 Tax=unclassified Agarivorans TaxID=2636026 RepID=UPI0010E5C1CD|nr:cellulase family glycosylhydrolase [Agarivorans sp. Toyoura001]GDY25370.1 hypothetical protein AHAT_12600 [Agarivorans sp. Toyoura001]